jgi:hypothetical protein
MSLSTHRRLSVLSAAGAITLAIASVSFAPVARAGDTGGESDAMWELYGLHAQGCARQPDSLGCVGFGSASGAFAATPHPSPAAAPARLRSGRHRWR